MSGKGAVLVTLVEIHGGAAPAQGADGGSRRWSLLRFCLWRLLEAAAALKRWR